jgi:mannose-1-phosphate guanylyltransferase
MTIKEAIILCGGQGDRLKPLTDTLPKPMIPVNGRPIIDHIISNMKRQGVERIIVACGYKWEKIRERYGDSLIYSVEKEPLGTGGALKQAMAHVKGNEFFVANSDDITDIDLKEFSKLGSNAICVAHFKSNFGIVDVDGDRVTGFRQKPLLPFWANVGWYLLNKSIPLPDKGSIEDLVFPKIPLKAYRHTGRWVTINSMKDLKEAEAEFKTHPLPF